MIKNLRFIFIASFSLGASLFISSCDKDMAISLDNENIDNLNVTTDDTLSAMVTTVQMPNIPTSGFGTLLVGKVNQPLIGSIQSSSSFRLNPASITGELPATAVFDSINLVLRPNNARYTYGDTTKFQTISAHRLTQTLETKIIDNSKTGGVNPWYITGAAIFGNQKFNYEDVELGSVRFLPHMNKKDSVSIRFNDALGKEFFNKIKNSDIAFNSADNFKEYFKGLTLVADENNTAMVGFSDTLELKLNYSYMGNDGLKKRGSKSLVMAEKTYQYNHYQTNRTGTPFEALSASKEINSSATNGISYIQSGTGVAAKISFPALKEFIQQPEIAINKAELEIEISNSHLGMFQPAPTPILLIGDENIPTTFVSIPFNPSEVQIGTYYLGNNTGKNGKYVFNLIEYIKRINEIGEEDKSLFLTLSPSELFNKASTSILAAHNNKPKVKLNIVYTKFK